MQLNEIYSVSACLALAQNLEIQACALRSRAKELKLNRSAARADKHDLADFARAVIYLKKLPDYHLSGATIWRSVARKFFINEDVFARHARAICAKRRRDLQNHKTRAALIMLDKGVKQTVIAQKLGLSPARICRIKTDGRDQLAANAQGVSLTTYRSLIKKPATSAG